MNFKPNAWTLLFALSMGALLFNMYGSKEEQKQEEVVIDSCEGKDPTKISRTVADSMMAKYAKYLKENSAIIDSLKNSKTGVENPAVLYFSIPKCELKNMISAIPGGHVNAHIGIKNNPKSGKPMLDLFFSDKEMKITNSSSGDVLAAKGGGNEGYWDFTRPCPTLCSE